MSAPCDLYWCAMNQADVIRQRFFTQHISEPRLAAPEAVVAWLGAMQSQDYAGAKWSVGQRVANGTDAEVERAFASGAILRTHVLRPTWHFVTPADIRWMLELTAPRVHALNAYYYRKFELDEAVFKRVHALFAQALQGGKRLTRPELAALLSQAGIVADKLRLSYIMMHAELEGLICSGAPRGKQQTYALLAERAPHAGTMPRDEALAELAHRFFASHGPATLKDFVWWSGLSVADAKAGLAMVERRLAHEVVDGQTLWFSAAAPTVEPAPMAACLLPEYDESILVYKSMNVPDLPWTIARDSWTDLFYRPVVIDEQRAGTWRRTIANGAVVIETNLFTSLDPDQARLLAAAAERFGAFLGMPAAVMPLQ
jgi:hypothetical protein